MGYMRERRKIPRRHILFYSRVFDRQTGIFLGYLGDMTEAGMMLISEKPLAVGKVFHLRIDLPDESYTRPALNFDARSAWSEKDIDPNFYNTGFEFVGISDETRQIVSQVIDDYGFRDDEFLE
ncbi:MAG TPA: PilZ domain-containing protein [Anaerolineales bacterium]|nr:PilZ domain-containing protein [Anaerolineales bacterium]